MISVKFRKETHAVGRDSYSSRITVEESKQFTVKNLKDWGYFEPMTRTGSIKWKNRNGPSGSIGISVKADNTLLRLFYNITDRYTHKEETIDYCVRIVSTKCNFGGVRYWFLCPLNGNGLYCYKRISTLYLPPVGKYFGCRHCHDLTYEAQKEHNKRLDFFKYFEYECKIDRLLDTGKVKDRNKALKLMEKRDDHIEKNWSKYQEYRRKFQL